MFVIDKNELKKISGGTGGNGVIPPDKKKD